MLRSLTRWVSSAKRHRRASSCPRPRQRLGLPWLPNGITRYLIITLREPTAPLLGARADVCGFGCSLRVLILYMMHHWLRSKADMRGRGEKKWLPGIVRVPVLFVGVHVERHAHNVCVLGERACGPCTLPCAALPIVV